MDLAQFESVKLKKVTGTRDRSAPLVAGQEHDASSSVEQFKNKIHAVNLENWYPLLKEHTFATEFLDLSTDEAWALVREFDRKRGKHAHEQTLEKDAQALQNLERRIDHQMATFKNAGAFVRLSTRSPKDAVISDERTMDGWKEELARLGPEAQTNENERLVALIKASTAALKVHSGQEALALLKASERSNEDLLLALEFPQQWDMKIVIRQWVDMHPAMEFRGFVCNKKLTALSQYFHIVYFPSLAFHKAEIAQRIRDYFERCIVQLIPLDNYVIDFGISNSGEGGGLDGCVSGGGDVLVIELNPFNDYAGCGTDPGLFEWRKDRAVVDGNAPFEFRVREAEFDVKPHIILTWRELIAV